MKPRNVRSKQDGAALVEFALVSLAAYILIAGGVELGRMIFVSQVLQDASRVAARELAVTPLPATDPFSKALEDSKDQIWNPDLLVIDLTCYDDAGLETYWASLPVVNRALRPIFIAETVDVAGTTRRIMRYPGALLKLSTPPANPCPATYIPGSGPPTDLAVAIPKVTYDPNDGHETGYTLVPIIAEVRCDPANATDDPNTDTSSPFRLDAHPPISPPACVGTNVTPGFVALSINYPFQSAMLSFFHNNANGPLEPNIANRIQADDTFAGSNEPSLPAGQSYADPQAAAPGSSIYTGPLGLGTQYAWAEKVRPYRNLISGQANYRREVFQ